MLGFLATLFLFFPFFFLREKKTADPEECTFSARTALRYFLFFPLRLGNAFIYK